MRTVCCYCGKVIGEKDGEGISHGICPVCFEKEITKLNEEEDDGKSIMRNDVLRC